MSLKKLMMPRESAYQAHKFANVLMPMTVQLGNISYIVCAMLVLLWH